MENLIQVGTADITDLEKQYVMDVLDRGALNNSIYTKRFEDEFASLHGCEFGIMVNSGTDALRIALASLKEVHGWDDGDEVLCPALTFVATANIIIQNNMKPVFVDVDEETYNIDPAEIPKRITSRTKAIIPVHLFGRPAEMETIAKLAHKHRLKMIEDSCETMFMLHGEKPVGSWGDFGCFSTYMAHLLTTGVGGVITTSSPKLHDIARSYMNHGRDPSFLGGVSGASRIGSEEVLAKRFKFDRLGYSSRVTEMEAALGCAQLERYASIVFARIANADLLKTYMVDAGLDEFMQLPAESDGMGNAHMMFPLVLKSTHSREALLVHLESSGIETRDLMPLLSQPIYRKLYGDKRPQFPNAAWLGKRGFYIGCHQKMTDADLKRIVNVLRSFFAKSVSA